MTQAHMASAIFNRYHLSWIGLDARLGRKPSTTNYTDTGSLVAMGEKRKKKKQSHFESHSVSANAQPATFNAQRLSLHVISLRCHRKGLCCPISPSRHYRLDQALQLLVRDRFQHAVIVRGVTVYAGSL